MRDRSCLLVLAFGAMTAGCFGPLPHPVTLADFGQVEVGAAVQTLSAAWQLDGMAQVGVLPHLQLEAQAGVDVWAQWQVQAGLRGELPLGDEDGIQLAALYDHQYYYAGCDDREFLFFTGNTGCPSVVLNLGGGELGWAHEFGAREPGRRRRPALGLFVELLGGEGEESGESGELLLVQARIAAELPLGDGGFALLLNLGGSTLVFGSGRFNNNHEATNGLSSLVLGVGLLFGT